MHTHLKQIDSRSLGTTASLNNVFSAYIRSQYTKENRKFFMGHTKVLEKLHVIFYEMKKSE
jgi:hypothetical protein